METNAQLIAEVVGQISGALDRRAVSQAVERAVRAGVAGIRVAVSGRLMGAEIARTERVGPVGSVPLHTLRADVDRGFSEAATGYGHIGVQVLVSRGIVLPPPKQRPTSSAEAEAETEVAVISNAGNGRDLGEAPAQMMRCWPRHRWTAGGARLWAAAHRRGSARAVDGGADGRPRTPPTPSRAMTC